MPKYLDENGVGILYQLLNKEDYPNNETLIAVINAIDETKANKEDIPELDEVLLKAEQELTAEEIEQVRQNIHSAGIMTEGLERAPFTVTEVRDYNDWDAEFEDPVICAQGSEIYNDYENNIASGMWSRASGAATQALGDFSDASGWLTKATAFCAIASGRGCVASGPYSHAEGMNTQALKNDSHAEGESCIANGARAHAEGYFTQANSNQAHSEGMNTIASGVNSHAEGWATTASGQNAFSGGKNTLAKGANSTARGLNTIANGSEQWVNGKFNIADTTSAFIIGNGTSDTARSNAALISKTGEGWFASDVYVGSTSGTTKDDGSVRLARIDEIGISVTDISDQVVSGYFDFSAVESGIYWSNTYISNDSGVIAQGLFSVIKITDTFANIWCVNGGYLWGMQDGVLKMHKKTLSDGDTYYDLTTTNQTILGAINELDEAIEEKAASEDLNNHKNDNEVHITPNERESWNSAVTTVSNLNQGLTLTDTITGVNYMITIANGKVTLTEVSE